MPTKHTYPSSWGIEGDWGKGVMEIIVHSSPCKLPLKTSLGADSWGLSSESIRVCDHLNDFLCARLCARLQSVCPPPFPHHWRHTLGRSPERTQEPAGLGHHLATERHIGLGSAVAAMEEPAVAATTTVREDVGRGGSVVTASGTAALP